MLALYNPRLNIFPAMVSAVDDAVGNVITALKRRNMFKNTIVVFLSDVSIFNGHTYSIITTIAVYYSDRAYTPEPHVYIHIGLANIFESSIQTFHR